MATALGSRVTKSAPPRCNVMAITITRGRAGHFEGIQDDKIELASCPRAHFMLSLNSINTLSASSTLTNPKRGYSRSTMT